MEELEHELTMQQQQQQRDSDNNNDDNDEDYNYGNDHNNDDDDDDEEHNWLMCAWFPEGSKTLRNPLIKWALTFNEYPYSTYPAYCSGLAYLAPLKLLGRLYTVAHLQQFLLLNGIGAHKISHKKKKKQENYKPLWIDDLFITGILRSSMLNKPKQINVVERYCFSKAQAKRYAKRNWPCTFSELRADNYDLL